MLMLLVTVFNCQPFAKRREQRGNSICVSFASQSFAGSSNKLLRFFETAGAGEEGGDKRSLSLFDNQIRTYVVERYVSSINSSLGISHPIRNLETQL
jgi:hypothetical protein